MTGYDPNGMAERRLDCTLCYRVPRENDASPNQVSVALHVIVKEIRQSLRTVAPARSESGQKFPAPASILISGEIWSSTPSRSETRAARPFGYTCAIRERAFPKSAPAMLDKNYDPQTLEKDWYQAWEDKGYFADCLAAQRDQPAARAAADSRVPERAD